MHCKSIVYLVLLLTMCIYMQQQIVDAKPFIFKSFVPQVSEPASTDTSSSYGSSTSKGIDFSTFLNAKLSFLARLLQTGLRSSISGNFNIGLKKFLPVVAISSTKRPHISTTITTPDSVFVPESTTKSSLESTESSDYDNNNKNKDNNNSSIRTTTGKSDVDYTTTKVTIQKAQTENADNSDSQVSTTKASTSNKYTTSEVTTSKVIIDNNNNSDNNYKPKPNGHGQSKPETGYGYGSPSHAMGENEISNEIMVISNQYLPSF